MRNIQGTEENLDLFNKDGVRVYEYRKDSDGFSYEYIYHSNGKQLTYKDSNGDSRGFDKKYTPEEVEFINRAVEYYWRDWNQEHWDNENDFKLTQQILNK